jgi:hypothetical protein
VDGQRDGVRPEHAAALGSAALVGVKCGGYAAVQWVRWDQLDVPDDGQGQQDRASCAGTDGDQREQFLGGQHVE